jgi:hypothetical protein
MASVCFADDRTLRRAQDGTQRTLIYPLVMTAENISSSIDASVRSSLIPSGSISPATNEQPGRFTVSDFFVQPSYSEPSQNLHPWSDYANPESDRSTSNVFYATGSSAAEVGLGFSALLASQPFSFKVNIGLFASTTPPLVATAIKSDLSFIAQASTKTGMFSLTFPEAGYYKLFVEWGDNNLASFWLKVSATSIGEATVSGGLAQRIWRIFSPSQ